LRSGHEVEGADKRFWPGGQFEGDISGQILFLGREFCGYALSHIDLPSRFMQNLGYGL
jgi:hypothetical protein